MNRTLLILICVVLLNSLRALAQPPFSGTIFIDPNIITATDPTALTNLTYAGQDMRLMFDRRANEFLTLNAYLFHATFDDGLTAEIQVNPEFNTPTEAGLEARKYAEVIGRLPAVSRSQVQTVWIHQGIQPFGGGNNNLLIHTGQAELYAADGILEETLVHESSHTSLDPLHSSAAGWIAAQKSDPDFISTYARDNPTREDIAESFLPWLAVRHRSSRLTKTLVNTITSAIPSRLAYFDAQNFDMYPILLPPVLTASLLPPPQNGVVLSWTTNSPAFTLQSKSQLLGPPDWVDSPLKPAVVNARFTITNRIQGSAQFYRLKKS